MEVAAVGAMEGSPAASGVPHPQDRLDCSRLAEVVGPRRAPPSRLVPHSGYGPPLSLHPALLLLHFTFPAVAEGHLSLSTLLIWSTGGEPGCVWRRWHPTSAPHKVQKLEKLYVDMTLQRELKKP